MTKENLGALIIESERQLYATAKTILRDDQDCADAIQETIVKAFSKIDSIKKDKYAKTWLIRVLINECYNLLRKESRYVCIEDNERLLDRTDAEKRDYSDLYKAVGALNEDLRVPIVLYYAEDFSVREIAQILDISEGAVQKRLARARMKLKKDLKQWEARE